MPGSTVFSNMTDEQLALWHQQDTRIQQLTRDLTEARTAADAAQAAAEVEVSNLKAALDRSCTTVLQLTAKNAEEKSATRRLCGQQVQTLKALRRLVAAVDQCDRCGWDAGARAVLTKIMTEAREVIALLDVPFG